MHHYFIIFKPYKVLSQFSSSEGKQTLADYFDVPKDVYPVGRLDYDSEGLLILTNDTQLNHRLLHPQHRHEREYYVQVEGSMTNDALQQLTKGVDISIDGKQHHTQRCKAKTFSVPPAVPERIPPIRFRKEIPTSWISLTLHEGKNRQVRKMTAKVGYPTLRLIRYRIAGLTLDTMLPGDMKQINQQELYKDLFS
jgi:23S rRNA pseudouridine2457 synthase